MNLTVINFDEKLASFSEHWSPKIVAQMNDVQFKLVKFQGKFVWHKHDDTFERETHHVIRVSKDGGSSRVEVG